MFFAKPLYPKSLQFQITLGCTGILFIVFAVLGSALYLKGSRQRLRDADVTLKAGADWIEALARAPAEKGDFSTFQEELEEHTDLAQKGRFVQILNASGDALFQSKNLEGRAWPGLPTARAGLGPCQWRFEKTVLPGRGPVRVVTQNGQEKEGEGAAFFIQIGMPAGEFQGALRRWRWMLLSGVPLASALIGLGGWALVGRALRPVDAIIRTARDIQPNDLGRRLEVPETGDEIERLSRTLNAMLERLERNSEQMKQFIADAAHEIRTPLGILRGETDVWLSAPRSAEEYRRALESHREEIDRLSGLVERLLFLSHLDAGQWRWQMRAVALRALLVELAEKARLLASDKGLEVVLQIDDGDGVVFGDEMRLRQLFLNLVDNAVKYSPAGGRVTISLRAERGSVRVDIRDQGIGISSVHLSRIFDRFYRVDRTRERQMGGYGLGLSIAKAIVEAHDGTLTAESRLGRGTVFSVRIPQRLGAPRRRSYALSPSD